MESRADFLRQHPTKLSEFRRTNSLVNLAFEVTYRTYAVARGVFCVRAKLANSHSRDRRETVEGGGRGWRRSVPSGKSTEL